MFSHGAPGLFIQHTVSLWPVSTFIAFYIASDLQTAQGCHARFTFGAYLCLLFCNWSIGSKVFCLSNKISAEQIHSLTVCVLDFTVSIIVDSLYVMVMTDPPILAVFWCPCHAYLAIELRSQSAVCILFVV
jgi:hypothetical protein